MTFSPYPDLLLGVLLFRIVDRGSGRHAFIGLGFRCVICDCMGNVRA
jgi:hypothetical protein